MASLLLPTNVRIRNTHTTIDIWFPIRNNTETLISLAPYLSGTHLPSELCARTAPTPSELGLGPPPWASYSATRTLIIDPDPDLIYDHILYYINLTNPTMHQTMWNIPPCIIFNRSEYNCAHFCYKMVHCGILTKSASTVLLCLYDIVAGTKWLTFCIHFQFHFLEW